MPQEVTVEQVRESQQYFKAGMGFHEEKKYKEAVEEFKKSALVNLEDEHHLEVLSKKLKEMSVKLVQESIAYMGCAAVHLNSLIYELDEEEQDLVPVDESLRKVFEQWD